MVTAFFPIWPWQRRVEAVLPGHLLGSCGSLPWGECRGWAEGDFCFADSLRVWMPHTCSVCDCGVRPGRSVDWKVKLAVFSATSCSFALKVADLLDWLLRGEDSPSPKVVFSQGPRAGVWLPCISAPKQRFGWLMV